MQSEEEYAELLSKNQERLFSYIFAWLRDNADAQDVLQKTSVVLWEKFDEFDRSTDFFRWAVVVAKYQSLNFLRQRRAYRARFSNEFMDAYLLDSLKESPEEEVKRDALTTCINKLSEPDRKLLRSRYSSGLKVSQIADLLGRSPSSISNSFRRIRTALLICVNRSIDLENHT